MAFYKKNAIGPEFGFFGDTRAQMDYIGEGKPLL